MSDRPGPPGDRERPSWMGAPGYTPHPELPPHAPMPGAPPYPAYEEHPLSPVGDRPGRTRYPRVLLATMVWAAVGLVVTFAAVGPVASTGVAGRASGEVLVPALLASVPTWLLLRRRGRPLWVVVLVALPAYVVLRVAFVLVSVAGS